MMTDDLDTEEITPYEDEELDPAERSEMVRENPKLSAFLGKWDRDIPKDRRCFGIKILFAGCESEVFRDGLYRVGVRHILLSYFHARKWMSKKSRQELAEIFGKFDFVFLDSGGFSFHQAIRQGEKLDVNLREYSDMYYADLIRFGDVFAGCAEVDVWELGEVYMEDKRAEMREKKVPLVPVVQGHPLEQYEGYGWWDHYPYIAVGSALLGSSKMAGYLTSLYKIGKDRGIVFHGFGATGERVILRSQFYSVDSTSWLGGGRYGNTMVFQNGRIRHYDKSQKDVRKRFKQRFEDNGLLYDDIINDKWLEVNLMNALAWRQWADYIRYSATKCYWLTFEEKSQAMELKSKAFNADGLIDRGTSLARAHARRLTQITDAGYDDRAHEALNCDTCHISGRCPRFKTGNVCGYDINIRLETRGDLQRAMQVILEAEFGRVMTGVLFEKMEGGVLDKNLSQEMASFFGMISQSKNIFDPYGNEELTIKARGGQGAVAQMLASVFSGNSGGSGNTPVERAANKGYDEDRAVERALPEEEDVLDLEPVPGREGDYAYRGDIGEGYDEGD